jgi:hypothetical protein
MNTREHLESDGPYRDVERCEHGNMEGSCIECRILIERKHIFRRLRRFHVVTFVSLILWVCVGLNYARVKVMGWYDDWEANREAEEAARARVTLQGVTLHGDVASGSIDFSGGDGNVSLMSGGEVGITVEPHVVSFLEEHWKLHESDAGDLLITSPDGKSTVLAKDK